MKKLHYCLPAALASLMFVFTCSCDGSSVDITDGEGDAGSGLVPR